MRRWILAAILILGSTGVVVAQNYPQYPYPYPYPNPTPNVPRSQIDGQWFFRGDPSKPCYIETVYTPQGPQLVLTNENGSQSSGRLLRDGRHFIAYDWNREVALVRGNTILWPGGGFWTR